MQMATKLGRVGTYLKRLLHEVTRPFNYLVLHDHATNEKCIFTIAMLMVNKVD